MRRAVPAAAIVGIALFATRSEAHFVLEAPPSWKTQTAAGSPQKVGPCGEEAGGTLTGTVTAFQTGSTITVTIHETTFHPGHYRIALAVNDRSELPPEPTVSPGATPCGSVPVQDPPVFPVLADGVFEHTQKFTAPQSVQITLPPGVTCTKCTLQVLEFMSNHLAPCFYHHCADISIQDVVVEAGPPDATTNEPDAGTNNASGAGQADSGCACSTPARRTSRGTGASSLFMLALLAWRRRATPYSAARSFPSR